MLNSPKRKFRTPIRTIVLFESQTLSETPVTQNKPGSPVHKTISAAPQKDNFLDTLIGTPCNSKQKTACGRFNNIYKTYSRKFRQEKTKKVENHTVPQRLLHDVAKTEASKADIVNTFTADKGQPRTPGKRRLHNPDSEVVSLCQIDQHDSDLADSNQLHECAMSLSAREKTTPNPIKHKTHYAHVKSQISDRSQMLTQLHKRQKFSWKSVADPACISSPTPLRCHRTTPNRTLIPKSQSILHKTKRELSHQGMEVYRFKPSPRTEQMNHKWKAIQHRHVGTMKKAGAYKQVAKTICQVQCQIDLLRRQQATLRNGLLQEKQTTGNAGQSVASRYQSTEPCHGMQVMVTTATEGLAFRSQFQVQQSGSMQQERVGFLEDYRSPSTAVQRVLLEKNGSKNKIREEPENTQET